MCSKKHFPSLCKVNSFHEELPEEFLDETDVDSYFHYNTLDISQSQHRTVRVSRGSNKNLFASKLLQFCDLKTQHRYILQEEVNVPKRELICLVDSLCDFVKNFHHHSKCIQISLPKPKVEIGSTKSKTRSLLIAITVSLNTQIDKSIFRSNSETTIIAHFPSQRLNYTAINLILQTLSTLTIAKFTISTRTDITLQTSLK